MLLQMLFDQSKKFKWKIPDTCPANTFYSYLHPFLKSSEQTKHCTKSCIGQLYCQIEPFMSDRNFCPDNAFRFVERLMTRSKCLVNIRTGVETDDIDSDQQILLNSIQDISVNESTVGTCDPHML
jgi:hypothetical protein